MFMDACLRFSQRLSPSASGAALMRMLYDMTLMGVGCCAEPHDTSAAAHTISVRIFFIVFYDFRLSYVTP